MNRRTDSRPGPAAVGAAGTVLSLVAAAACLWLLTAGLVDYRDWPSEDFGRRTGRAPLAEVPRPPERPRDRPQLASEAPLPPPRPMGGLPGPGGGMAPQAPRVRPPAARRPEPPRRERPRRPRPRRPPPASPPPPEPRPPRPGPPDPVDDAVAAATGVVRGAGSTTAAAAEPVHPAAARAITVVAGGAASEADRLAALLP